MVAWCLIYWIYRHRHIATVIFSNVLGGRELFTGVNLTIGINETLRLFALHPFRQPYLGVVWFLRTLFVLVLLSPVLKPLSCPIPILLVWLLHGIVHPDYGVKCTALVFTFQEGFLSLFGASYFMAGILLRTRHVDLHVPKRYGFIALSFALLMILLRGNPYGSHLARLMTWFSIPFLIVGVWSLCPEKRFPDFFVKASFPVYVLHMFVISELRLRFDWWLKDLTAVKYSILGLASFAVCLVASYILRRIFPRPASFLFGGR